MKQRGFLFRLVFLSMILATMVGVIQAQGLVAAVQSNLSLRVCAGTEWRRVATLPAGMNIALDGRITDSSWARGITQNGDIGWIYTPGNLNVSMDQIASLPVINCDEPISVPVPPPGNIVEAPSAPAEQPEASAPQAPANNVAPSTSGVTVTAHGNLNMRSGPDTSYRRVGGVSYGDTLLLDGQDGNLNWVRGANNRGEVGWVAANLTSITLNEILSLPAISADAPFSLPIPGGGAPAAAPEEAAPDTNAALPPPVTSNSAVRGFSYGGHIRELNTNTANYMYSAGMTWVKIQVRYNQGDDPSGWSGFINLAHSLGFRVLLGVVGNPGQVLNGGYNDAYAGYVAGLAALGVDAVEIWNEPNIDREWPSGHISGGNYTQMLAASYNAIKSVNANTMVISAAPAPTGYFGGCSGAGCDDQPFIQQMAAAGAARYMDCAGAHYNEGIVPPSWTSGDPRGEFHTRYFGSMVNIYYRTFGKPVCFTELGYLSPEGYGPLPGGFAWAGDTSVGEQAAWLDGAISRSRSSGRVRLVIVWNVDFTGIYGDDPMGGYAIIRPDGSCPACAALGN
ncbi:MAG: SH3 domain-containing protein [Anaerolineae bacterium]|nr:SH3 domain-containing protein [Anaerolineae bacterium]